MVKNNNMNLFKYLGIFILLSGCSNHETLLKDLKLINNKYFYKEKDIPFTGIVTSAFKTGQISSKVTLKNGIPAGYWVAYGYKGEIVQDGTYRPIYLTYNNVDSIKGIKRINICFTKEGERHFIDLIIITNSRKLEFDRRSDMYKAVIDTLISNKVRIDASLINKISCSKSELEW